MLRRHEDYPCNDTTAERWLHHSQIAFEQVVVAGQPSLEGTAVEVCAVQCSVQYARQRVLSLHWLLSRLCRPPAGAIRHRKHLPTQSDQLPASKQVPEIDDDSRLRMERFFKWMAYFLVRGCSDIKASV